MTAETNLSVEPPRPLRRTVESDWFRNFIMGLIIANAVILGILTYRTLLDGFVQVLRVVDMAITWVFVTEILLKMIVYRLGFFRSGWNWFDFLVVGISLIPGGQAFSVMRALRVLRVLRLLHIVPMMKQVTEALIRALPGMGAILALLALITYVAAVMATNLFGDTETEEVAQLFSDLPRSALSLFQVMTMDGWRFEVVQKVVDDGHPYAWVFFLIFIFVASFLVLNLFIALIVEALQVEQEAMQEEQIEALEEEAEEAHAERAEILTVLKELKQEIAALKATRDGK
ncbi:MAG: ion transporter [Alphaproteobacteria bacterium]|jgi:voltage-gated sodium channel|nr:ion transporter [Alphaproteobacteria bacterium]